MSQISEDVSATKLLLSSNSYRVKHLINVNDFINKYSLSEINGNCTPLSGILSFASSLLDHNQTPEVIDNSDIGHATRIALMVLAIKAGWVPDPIIFDSSGRLIDGIHRLAALNCLNIPQAKAISFTEQTVPPPARILQNQDFAPLLNVSGFSEQQLTIAQNAFRGARGYSRAKLPDVLDKDFASLCSDEVAQLDWHRLETTSFSKDVVVIKKENTALPSNFRKLADLLTSSDFRELMQIISGNQLLEVPTLFLNRLGSSDQIGLHNDYHPQKETLRCVMYLGSTVKPTIFGAFVSIAFNDSPNLLDFYPPIHNSMVIFEISPFSYHLVTPNDGSIRYSVVLSYFEKLIKSNT